MTYLDRAEVNIIGKLIEILFPFVEKLSIYCEKNKDIDPFIEKNSKGVDQLLYMYNTITNSNYLVPWSGLGTVEANRQYLIQEKAIDHSLKLYSLLLDNPGKQTRELISDLEVSCLGLLWNFAETQEARLYVVKRGGFGLMLRSLENCSHDTKGDRKPYNMYGQLDRVVGCVSK